MDVPESVHGLKKGRRTTRNKTDEGQKDEATTHEKCDDFHDGKKHSNQGGLYGRPHAQTKVAFGIMMEHFMKGKHQIFSLVQGQFDHLVFSNYTEEKCNVASLNALLFFSTGCCPD